MWQYRLVLLILFHIDIRPVNCTNLTASGGYTGTPDPLKFYKASATLSALELQLTIIARECI